MAERTSATVRDCDGGRPRTLLDLDPEYGFVVGADIGETRVQVGRYDLALGRRVAAECRLDPAEYEPDLVVAAVAAGLREVLETTAVPAGAALNSGGGIYRAAISSAGEWGHTTIVADGRRCR